MESPRTNSSVEHHLNIIQMLDLLSIWLVLSKDTYCLQTRDKRKLKLLLVSELTTVVSILDQSILFGETHSKQSSFYQLVIGLPRFGVTSSSSQLCKLGIIHHTLQMAAGLQHDVDSSISQELMVSWMSGISSISKTKLPTARRSLITH